MFSRGEFLMILTTPISSESFANMSREQSRKLKCLEKAVPHATQGDAIEHFCMRLWSS